MSKRITSPLDDNTTKDLKAGDQVLINGIIYTARDAAHKRLTEALDRGEDPPFRQSRDRLSVPLGQPPAGAWTHIPLVSLPQGSRA